MTAGAHDAGGGFGRSAGANLARGIGVIVVAVVIGLLLMNRGLGERVEASASAETTATTEASTEENLVTEEGDATTDDAANDDDAAAAETTTVPTAAARPPAEVKVLVLNGTNGIKGVAGRGTTVVTDAGYIAAEAKNADVDGASVILYMEGFEADARAVATAFGVDPDAVVAPFDAASSPIADTQASNIVVRIGNDGVIQV